MRKFSRMRKCLHLVSLRRPRRPCASCVFGAAPRTSCPAGSAEASCADHLYKCLWHTQNCNIRAARIRVGSWQTINHMTRKWTWTLTGLPTRLCASWIMKLSDWSDWSKQTRPCKCRNPGHPNCTGSRSHVDQEGAPSARKYLRSRPALRWYSCGLWVVNESRPVCLIIWQNFAEEVPCPTFLDWHIWSLQFCFFKLVSSSTCSNCMHLPNSPSLRYYQIDLCESPCSWRWAWPVPLNCHEFTRMQPHRSWALANGGRRPWESLIIVGFLKFFSF